MAEGEEEEPRALLHPGPPPVLLPRLKCVCLCVCVFGGGGGGGVVMQDRK